MRFRLFGQDAVAPCNLHFVPPRRSQSLPFCKSISEWAHQEKNLACADVSGAAWHYR